MTCNERCVLSILIYRRYNPGKTACSFNMYIMSKYQAVLDSETIRWLRRCAPGLSSVYSRHDRLACHGGSGPRALLPPAPHA